MEGAILRIISPYFGKSIELDDGTGKNIKFEVKEENVKIMHELIQPDTVDGKKWYYVSHIYWGQGYHSNLRIDEQGNFRIFHSG